MDGEMVPSKSVLTIVPLIVQATEVGLNVDLDMRNVDAHVLGKDMEMVVKGNTKEHLANFLPVPKSDVIHVRKVDTHVIQQMDNQSLNLVCK